MSGSNKGQLHHRTHEQKETGPETDVETRLQHRHKVHPRNRAKDRTGDKLQTCIQRVLPGDDQHASLWPKSIEEIGPEEGLVAHIPII